MARSDGHTSFELEARLAQVRALIPANEAALAEAEPQVQPAYEEWMARRAFLGQVATEFAAIAQSHQRAAAELERASMGGERPPAELVRAAEALQRQERDARAGRELARDEEHQAQQAYNRTNLAAHNARQNLTRLRSHEESLARELAGVQRQGARDATTTTAAKGWLASLREKVAGAAA